MRWQHHVPCPCDCGELSDECAGPVKAPLGSMEVRWTDPSLVDVLFGRGAA